MKKIIMIFTIFAMLLVSCSNDTSSTNESDEHKLQLLASMTQYDVSGTEMSKETYVYNENGKLIEENTISEDYSTKRTYVYNDKGQLTEEAQIDSFDGKTEILISMYEYDQNGNQILKIRLNETGEQIGRISYHYDNENRLIKVQDEAINQSALYEYKGKNKYSVRSEYTFGETNIFSIIDYELDNSGNIIHQVIYSQNSDVLIEQEQFNYYDENDNIISSKTYIFGELVESIEYEYYDTQLTRKKLSDGNGIYQTEEFEYNEYGNIAKQTKKTKSGVILNYIIFDYSDKFNQLITSQN